MLIVEDELIIALDIKEILNEEGYDAIINIVSVEAAIVAIENSSPDLVLIDINLKQDKDGIDLGKYLLQKDKIPFIYITSYSDKSTLDRVSLTRPYGYVVKPFKPEDLKATVSVVINNFKHRNIDVLRREIEINSDIPFILKQSIDYINENLTEKVTVADLVKQTRWSSQHFNRLFTQYVGMTPYQYIMQKKIEKAKILITEFNMPITQVSYELGFKAHSNFCTLFKKVTGKTAENYRKWHEVNSKFVK